MRKTLIDVKCHHVGIRTFFHLARYSVAVPYFSYLSLGKPPLRFSGLHSCSVCIKTLRPRVVICDFACFISLICSTCFESHLWRDYRCFFTPCWFSSSFNVAVSFFSFSIEAFIFLFCHHHHHHHHLHRHYSYPSSSYQAILLLNAAIS